MDDQDRREIVKALQLQRLALIETLGMFVVKTLLTLNAGAIVVLMTLLGSLASGDATLTADIIRLRSSVFWFLGGIASVLLTVGFVYVVAQVRTSLHMRQPPPERKAGGYLPWLYLVAMILLPVISFALFCIGFLVASSSFT